MTLLDITLPRLGETMDSGQLVQWLKQPGDWCERGEPLLELETDKTVVELPSLVSGRLVEIVVHEGARIDVGSVIGRMQVAALPVAGADPAHDVAPGTLPAAARPAVADATAPRGATPGGALQADAVRGDAVPDHAEPRDSAQGDAAPGDSAPGDSAPGNSASGDSASRDPASRDSSSDDSAPGDAAPGDSAPRDATARDATARDATARDATARDAAPNHAAPGHAVARHAGAARAPTGDASAGMRRATPVARRLAASHGVSLDGLHGSGRRGRIEASDVQRAVSSRAEPTAVTAVAVAVAVAAATAVTATTAAAGTAGTFHPASTAAGGLAWRQWQPDASAATPRGTVVLLHGHAGDHQTWAVLAAQLVRQGRAVLAPDLPAHGASLAEADDLDALVPPLQAWLQATCGGPYELVGHSMGAVAAVRLASTGPAAGRCTRVTLIAPAGLGFEIDAALIRALACVDRVDALRHLVRHLALQPPSLSQPQLAAMVAQLGPRGRLHGLAASLAGSGLQQVDIRAALAALGAHARVVVGLEDRVIPWQQVLDVGAATAVHLVRGAGHMVHWDQPLAIATLFA